jgi:hypothetical protein
LQFISTFVKAGAGSGEGSRYFEGLRIGRRVGIEAAEEYALHPLEQSDDHARLNGLNEVKAKPDLG